MRGDNRLPNAVFSRLIEAATPTSPRRLPDTAKTPSAHVFSTVWSRTLRDHWVSALVVRSGNLEERPSTIVCHFKSTNYVFDHSEWFSGDQTGSLKAISLANLDLRAWFK